MSPPMTPAFCQKARVTQKYAKQEDLEVEHGGSPWISEKEIRVQGACSSYKLQSKF